MRVGKGEKCMNPCDKVWKTEKGDRSDTNYVIGPRWELSRRGAEVQAEDGYLMAAAPDMYRAIEEMVRCVRGGMCCYEGRSTTGPMEDAVSTALEALAKARGE